MFKKIYLISLTVFFVLPAIAQPIRVAVAANAQFVARKLAADFKSRTGLDVEVIGGSSGKLSTQIKNGAPYDIFLSADMDFAQGVYDDGFAVNKPKIYAVGSLIVCSTTNADIKGWQTYLTNQKNGKIAIANPKLAPYGNAAEQALKYLKLYDNVKGRLVFGESISQVNTYVLKGVVNIGFTTESLVHELPAHSKFTWQRIDVKTYHPIEQGAVLLKYARNKNYSNNKRFFDYLFSPGAKAIFKQFGYRIYK